ncbi:MAG: nicotinate-nucleotide adenylyltransferase [Arsenophonus sp.]|nr:MAG: nicotinate-nucleotide adenylyltransferase [Arsenophonus sp.]
MILQNKKKSNFHKITTIFGGTFDPIHNGHLIPVTQLAKKIGLKKIILVPNNLPSHRQKPVANIQQRIEMIKLAIKNNPLFSIDFREINQIPSYTITTLISFRKEIGWKKPLIFILGEDSLLSIQTWFCWKKILTLCHLIVCARSNSNIYFQNKIMQKWLKEHQIHNPKILNYKVSNKIYLFKNPLLNISATTIRQRKNKKKSCHNMLPESVSLYIDKNNLYQDYF